MFYNKQRELSRARSNGTSEYRVYFAIIFTLALPFSIFFWFRDLLVGDFSALHHGIVGRALTEASVTTPKIFSV